MLTHAEIAEMIGTTRGTVSRLFSDIKKKQLLQLKGSTLIICNKSALAKLVYSQPGEVCRCPSLSSCPLLRFVLPV
jgi:Crp-like helix-turn-helix domain